MALSKQPNPVAEEVQQDVVQQYTEELKTKWDAEVPQADIPWWKFWENHTTCHKVTLFLLNCMDLLILEVDKLALMGKEKKAVVLSVINGLYDYIIQGVIPIWAKPFAPTIKNYIVNVIISDAIDFTVSKYHSAVWPSASGISAGCP